LDNPFVFHFAGQEHRVQYLPAESNTGMFGGNSYWRGPIWMPMNALLIRGLLNLYQFYGDEFKVECPTGSGKYMTLSGVAKEVARRLSSIFVRDASGRRPVYVEARSFKKTRTGEIAYCSTSISTATTEPVLAPGTEPDGQEPSRGRSICSHV